LAALLRVVRKVEIRSWAGVLSLEKLFIGKSPKRLVPGQNKILSGNLRRRDIPAAHKN